MKKQDKIRILANSIIALNQASEKPNEDIHNLAREISYLTDGNPNFALLSSIGFTYDEIREKLVEEFDKEKMIVLE